MTARSNNPFDKARQLRRGLFMNAKLSRVVASTSKWESNLRVSTADDVGIVDEGSDAT